ncbi:MAG: DUF2851 family protein [Bacteroidales bacterium]|nr:DUF2851 family protein [Bacteroidales bacterium]
MNEKLLSFIWFNRLFPQSALRTTQGESISIINSGFTNNDSGPDITDAQIRIGDIVWAGNIELHVKSSHWQLHHHDNNPAFSNIILHIVFHDDKPLKDQNGNLVPTLVLPFEQRFADTYYKLLNTNDFDLCRCGFERFGGLKTSCFLDRLAGERLKNKALNVLETLRINHGDWKETFWQTLSAAFGLGKNALPFKQLAQSVPFSIVEKNRHQISNIAAILFGQAGFFSLKKFSGEPYLNIQREYYYHKQKYNLTPIDPSVWKFSGIRPVNFPDRRILQLSMLVGRNENLFSLVMEAETLDSLYSLFDINTDNAKFSFLPDITLSKFGIDTLNLLVINLVCPFLYAYSLYFKDDEAAQRAIAFLEKIPPENNSVTKFMVSQGIEARSALDSQAFLYLRNEFCRPKRCIECQVGRYIVINTL